MLPDAAKSDVFQMGLEKSSQQGQKLFALIKLGVKSLAIYRRGPTTYIRRMLSFTSCLC